MADLSITATSVVKGTGAKTTGGIAGETLTAGQAVYKKASDGLIYKADNDADTSTPTVIGIALHGAAVNQPIAYQTEGEITIGATVAVGETYVLSSTAGGICPEADANTGDKMTLIGFGKTAAILLLNIYATGITHA